MFKYLDPFVAYLSILEKFGLVSWPQYPLYEYLVWSSLKLSSLNVVYKLYLFPFQAEKNEPIASTSKAEPKVEPEDIKAERMETDHDNETGELKVKPVNI